MARMIRAIELASGDMTPDGWMARHVSHRNRRLDGDTWLGRTEVEWFKMHGGDTKEEVYDFDHMIEIEG